MTPQDPNPHEALASIKAARATLDRDINYPVGWDIIYGGVCGALVIVQALPTPFNALMLGLSVAALAFMMQWWKKKTGWWVNGYGPKNARWVAIGLTVILLAMMAVTFRVGNGDSPWWAAAIAGGVTWISATVGGRLWMRAYRKDLAETRA